ncbi:MAG: ROK family protein [Firmicutes bacterium]|nr:ROK family protein [Bacillota bacterium]
MKSDLYCLVDIGGTKILMLLIDENGRVLFRGKRSTPKPTPPESLIDTVKTMLIDAKRETGSAADIKPLGLGICIAGFIESEQGIIYQSPNLDWVKPVHFRSMLESNFSCPVIIENDANAAVLGEVYYGAAKGHDNVIYVTISTGIGGGLFLNGRIYRGSTGFAGEIGHIKPFGTGRVCKCGGDNCLEIWAAGSAIAMAAKTLWDENDPGIGPISTEWVFEQADQGNEIALSIINDAALKTGRGLANLVTLLNPSCIVVGGGVAAGRPDYMEKVKIHIYSEAIPPSVNITKVELVAADLEPEAGIWGIYALLTGRAVR